MASSGQPGATRRLPAAPVRRRLCALSSVPVLCKQRWACVCVTCTRERETRSPLLLPAPPLAGDRGRELGLAPAVAQRRRRGRRGKVRRFGICRGEEGPVAPSSWGEMTAKLLPCATAAASALQRPPAARAWGRAQASGFRNAPNRRPALCRVPGARLASCAWSAGQRLTWARPVFNPR